MMNASGMATLIVTNLKIENPDIDTARELELIVFWTAICQGIIDEIVANAVVEVEVTSGSSAGTYQGEVIS